MRVGHAGATTERIIWAFNSRQILIVLRMWAPMSGRDSGGGQMYGCQTTAHAPAKRVPPMTRNEGGPRRGYYLQESFGHLTAARS